MWWRHGSGIDDSTSGVSMWLWWLAAKIAGPLEVVQPVEAVDARATASACMAGRTSPCSTSTRRQRAG